MKKLIVFVCLSCLVGVCLIEYVARSVRAWKERELMSFRDTVERLNEENAELRKQNDSLKDSIKAEKKINNEIYALRAQATELRTLESTLKRDKASQSGGPTIAETPEAVRVSSDITSRAVAQAGHSGALAESIVNRLAQYDEERLSGPAAGEFVKELAAQSAEGPPQDRYVAVKALGRMRSHLADAVDALIPCINDNEPTVRDAAKVALRSLGSDALPYIEASIKATGTADHSDLVAFLENLSPKEASRPPSGIGH